MALSHHKENLRLQKTALKVVNRQSQGKIQLSSVSNHSEAKCAHLNFSGIFITFPMFSCLIDT